MSVRNQKDSQRRPYRRASSTSRRSALAIGAALITVAATIGALVALRHPEPERWVHLSVYIALLAMLGVMFVLFRQNELATAALENANLEMVEAIAKAEAAQAHAEGEANQKARLAALLDAALGGAPVAFAFFDRETRLLRVNQTFAAYTGHAPADHIGLSLAEIDRALAAQVDPQLESVLRTGAPMMNVEHRWTTTASAGEPRVVLGNYYPIIEAGELFGIGAALVDISELKTLEEQLLQAQKMEAVGRLAGGVAHDFNNLLTVISSYAELILHDAPTTSRDEIAEIRGATKRAANLTRQLLAFSRRQAMEPRIVNPNDVVRGVESMIRRLSDPSIVVRCKLSPDTPLVRVDPGQLEQVVMNLAINAADAMPDGGALTIETTGKRLEHKKPDRELPDGEYAVVRVCDTGHGMDEQTIAQIFEPFFTTKEPGKGTGLGLSTAYGILKQSGGSIGVESTVGRGSEFCIYLPAADVQAPF